MGNETLTLYGPRAVGVINNGTLHAAETIFFDALWYTDYLDALIEVEEMSDDEDLKLEIISTEITFPDWWDDLAEGTRRLVLAEIIKTTPAYPNHYKTKWESSAAKSA